MHTEANHPDPHSEGLRNPEVAFERRDLGARGILLFFADRMTGGTGVAGVAAASTAGNAAAVPAIVAASNPVYAEAAKSATILVAACVVVTAILVPFATAWAAKTFGSMADLPDDDEDDEAKAG